MYRWPFISVVLIIAILLVLAFVLNLSIGEVWLNPFQLFFSENLQSAILISEFRLPRAIAAVLVGSALSLSGLMMQTLFRNPIAGPYVLGISSGSVLGVSLVILGGSIFSAEFLSSNSAIIIAALVGGLAMMFILLMVLKIIKDIMTLLIVGMMFGAFATSVSSILQYFSPGFQVKAFVLWTFGSLSKVDYPQIYWMISFIVLALFFVVLSLKGLNLLTLGTSQLEQFGIKTKRLHFIILLATALLTSSVTAFCGPIGFIGVIVPHISKKILKTSNHWRLMPVSMMIGAFIMLVSEMLTHLPGSGMVLPINSVTAFIGIPFILWILFKPLKNEI